MKTIRLVLAAPFFCFGALFLAIAELIHGAEDTPEDFPESLPKNYRCP